MICWLRHFGAALLGLTFGIAAAFMPATVAAQNMGRMELVCVGGGSAIKDASASAHFTDAWGNAASGAIYGTRRVGFNDEVSLWVEHDEGRIRMPSIMLPLFRGGDNGWFKLKSIKVTDREIIGSVSVNLINNPKLRIDRYTGAISIAGKAGNFTGRCAHYAPAYKQNPVQKTNSTTALYQTVDHLARNAAVPFLVETTAGIFTVTKIEALSTQLRMDVQVNDPQLTLADVASSTNLQVVCADPSFNEVLRLGGSTRLTFVHKSGALLGVATQTRQSCGL